MSNAVTARRRTPSEQRGHEIYYKGEPVEFGLTKHELKQRKRELARRSRRWRRAE